MSGTYKQEISATKNLPGCLIVLLDQSGSMAEQFGADKRSKAVAAARAVNTALESLVDQCIKGESLRDDIHVGVIGFGGKAAQDFLWGGSGPGGLLTVSELEAKAQFEEIETDEDDGTGKLKVEKRSKWFDPFQIGCRRASMDLAFKLAVKKLTSWVDQFPNSFPPIVFVITGGGADDRAQAEKLAGIIKQVQTTNGAALLCICHVVPPTDSAFPTDEAQVSDLNGKWLFKLASEMPDHIVRYGTLIGLQTRRGSRCYVTVRVAGKFSRLLSSAANNSEWENPWAIYGSDGGEPAR